MIDIEKKLEKIEKDCCETAKKELIEIKKSNEDISEKQILDKVEDYKEELSKKYEASLNKMQREYNKYLFDYEKTEKIKINKFRENLIENIKSKIEDEFLKFTESNEYENYLLNNLHETLQKVGDYNNCTVYITEKDYYKFNEKILNQFKVNLFKIENENIGGCKIINENKRLAIDNTLKTNIEEKIKEIVI